MAKLRAIAYLRATALKLQAILPLQLHANGLMEVCLNNIILQFNQATYIYTIKQRVKSKLKK